MRLRLVVLAAAATLLAVVALWSWRGSGPSRATAPHAAAPAVTTAPDAGASALDGPTPALERPAAGTEGALEVRVVASGAPQRGAEVRVYLRRAVEPGTGLPGWRLAGTAPTGTDGVAVVPAGPGAYLVAARAAGFPAAHVEVFRPSAEPRTRVEVALVAGVAVSGRVVTRGTHEPVPLATLVLTPYRPNLRARSAPMPTEERLGASADATGRFRFPSVAPGGALVEAQAPGFARAQATVVVPHAGEVELVMTQAAVMDGFVFAADGSPAEGAEVTLAGGSDLARCAAGASGGFSVEVAPGTYTASARRGDQAGALAAPLAIAAGRAAHGVVIRLGPGGAIAGRVIAREGAPVAGASVGLSPHDHDGEYTRTTTGDGGHFAFDAVAAGRYDLDVTAEGFTPAVRSGLALLAGQRFEIELALDGTGAVEGTVTDAAGRPVAGARVRGGRRFGGDFGSVGAETRADAAGRYRLTGLERGGTEVSALHDGASAGASTSVIVAPGEVAHADLVLSDAGTLEGTVTLPGSGAPPRPALVVAFPAGRGRRVETAPVEASGAWRLQLAAGDYRVAAAWADAQRGLGRDAVAVRVDAGATTRLDLTLRDRLDASAGSTTVQVLEPGGAPSPGAVVVAFGAGGERVAAASADQDGRAALDVPADAGRVVVRARNGGRTSGGVEVSPGGAATIQLRTGVLLRGRLVAPTGPTPAGFTLELTGLGEDQARIPPLGLEFAGDRFEVSDVPALRIGVSVRAADGRRGQADVTLGDAEVRDVEVPLEAAAAVAGRAVDAATGQALANPLVWVTAQESPSVERDRGGPDGRFRIEGLPSGSRRVRVAAAGHQPVEREVRLVAGGVVDLGDVPLAASRASP
jgi:hypothetical protein